MAEPHPAPGPVVDHLAAAGFDDPVTSELVGWDHRVRAMVAVERALAEALGRVGIVTQDEARAAVAACDAATIDPTELAAQAARAATPVIPLLAALRATAGPDTELRALHLGATSQDIIDTAIALQVRSALDRLEELLLRVGDRCVELATDHAGTVMAGRTLAQQAVPLTFGLKAARWVAAVDRRIVALRLMREDQLAVQLGGAVGTAGTYGDRGLELAATLAEILGLPVPLLPRHGERDHLADLAGALGAVAGTVGSIALDLILLAQTEIAEVGFGGDGPTSSTMPQKRNPVDAVAARAAAGLAASAAAGLLASTGGHELERAAGAWQSEWVALPALLARTAGATLRLAGALDGVAPDPDRMQHNLDVGLGLTSAEALRDALVTPLGPTSASRLVAEVSRAAVAAGRPLRETALDDVRIVEAIGTDGVRTATDPATSLQLVPELIARALARHRSIRTG